MLAEIYNWFTEGFDTVDLKEAKALLEELSVMRCAACGHENRDGQRFCAACGAPLELSLSGMRRTPTPRPSLLRRMRRGTRLSRSLKLRHRSASRAPTPPNTSPTRSCNPKSALEGERKQVTVLFADVKGSMELAEQVDPEEWHRIMDRFFQILTDGVHRFEGTVNQYTGDGIMALFGAPIAHEDHAQRACYAALAPGRGAAALWAGPQTRSAA